MKRIAILTFIKTGNYGGDLQSFALQKKISSMGYNVEVINQLRPTNKEFIKSNDFKQIYIFDDKISKKGKFNSIVSNFLNKLFSLFLFKRNKKKEERFASFENHINLTKQIFYNYNQLYDSNLDYDIYIVGSDQVWDFNNSFSVEPYFLTFVKGKKKISYAASIGHSVIPESVQFIYKKWLEDFDFISTREEKAAELLNKITGREIKTVLDPTFLLTKEEWGKYAMNGEMYINKPYLLIYMLSESEYIIKLAKYIADLKKLQIIRIMSKTWTINSIHGIQNIYDGGPWEFINLFKNASFVITNSFHGTAFSINFNIPFFSVPKKNNKVNSRFLNILDKLNLSNRLIYDGDDLPDSNEIDMDFKESNILLEFYIKESLNFIENSLKE